MRMYIDAKKREYIDRMYCAIKSELLSRTTRNMINVSVTIEQTAVKFKPTGLYTSLVKALCVEEIVPRLQAAGWRVHDVNCYAHNYDDDDGFVRVSFCILFPDALHQ